MSDNKKPKLPSCPQPIYVTVGDRELLVAWKCIICNHAYANEKEALKCCQSHSPKS